MTLAIVLVGSIVILSLLLAFFAGKKKQLPEGTATSYHFSCFDGQIQLDVNPQTEALLLAHCFLRLSRMNKSTTGRA